jgi:GH25 family lysozyme M1 (1,4-beta-N-acetylmuramidase)
MTRAKIFDVSWWQFAERHYDENGNEFIVFDWDNIDFVAAKAAGFDGVIIRASHGWRVDESFELAYELAKDAGLLVGAYHYIYVDAGFSQWQNFWNQIKDKDLELGFWFDQEVHSNGDATASQWQACINANVKGIVDESAEVPGFYTSYWMWELTGPMMMINGKPTKDYLLWTAHWHFDFEEMPDPAIPAKYGDGVDPEPDPDPDPDPEPGVTIIQYQVYGDEKIQFVEA